MSSDIDVDQSLRRSLAIRIGIALAVLGAAVVIVAATMLGGPEVEEAAAPAATERSPMPPEQPRAAELPAETGKPLSSDAPGGAGSAPADNRQAGAQDGESQPASAGPQQSVQKLQDAGDVSAPAGGRHSDGSTASAVTPPLQSGGNQVSERKDPLPVDSAQVAAAEALRSPPGAKPPRGPHLQAGVFLQPSNAQSFKANLEKQGLPVYIESRVHVGPFRDRKEAERVREQLREMGVATVLIAQ